MEASMIARPHHAEVWVYNRTGVKYYITDVGEMKIGSGELVESVSYKPVEDATTTYTRDLETFMTKFTRMK